MRDEQVPEDATDVPPAAREHGGDAGSPGAGSPVTGSSVTGSSVTGSSETGSSDTGSSERADDPADEPAAEPADPGRGVDHDPFRPGASTDDARHDDLDDDDLAGATTSMSRLVAGARSWLAILIAIGLAVPAVAWVVDEYVFQRSADAVIATLDGDRSGAAAAETVLLVRTVGCAGTASTGSAFVVETADGPALVTNRHVVEGARSVGVQGLDGTSDIRVTGVRLSDTADVAVLAVADPDLLPPALALGGGVPARDTPIRLVGFPAGTPFTDAGRVVEVRGTHLLLEVEVSPGASGSPVVADDGRVVGQIFATSDDGRGVATPAGALRAAIGDARPSEPC